MLQHSRIVSLNVFASFRRLTALFTYLLPLSLFGHPFKKTTVVHPPAKMQINWVSAQMLCHPETKVKGPQVCMHFPQAVNNVNDLPSVIHLHLLCYMPVCFPFA